MNPRRVTLIVFGGATYLGSIDLPQGSENHVFARKNDAIMAVWNRHPTHETAYLGDRVRKIGLWGHETMPRTTEENRQVIEVDRMPTFVAGLDPAVAGWRMNCHFAHHSLPSVFAVSHRNTLTFRNTFNRGVVGRAIMAVPEGWRVEPAHVTFRLAEGESMQQPFTITLPFDAGAGRHSVPIDFEIRGTPDKRFRVYRHVDVGLGAVHIDVKTRMNDQGELEVVQQLTNEGDSPVSFRCQLFIAGRRHMTTQVLGMTRGHDEQVYRLADGEELLGQPLWLRAEEMSGPRVLNYRLTATP